MDKDGRICITNRKNGRIQVLWLSIITTQIYMYCEIMFLLPVYNIVCKFYNYGCVFVKLNLGSRSFLFKKLKKLHSLLFILVLLPVYGQSTTFKYKHDCVLEYTIHKDQRPEGA